MEAFIPRHHLHPVVVLERTQPPRPVLQVKRRRSKGNKLIPTDSFVELKSELCRDHFPHFNDADVKAFVEQMWENLDMEEKKLYIEYK